MAERIRVLRAILLAPFYVRSLLPSLPPSGCLEVFTNLSFKVLREWYLVATADQCCHGYLPRLLPTPSVCPIGDRLNVIFNALDLFFFFSTVFSCAAFSWNLRRRAKSFYFRRIKVCDLSSFLANKWITTLVSDLRDIQHSTAVITSAISMSKPFISI